MVQPHGGALTPFRPGASGNPGGRPKLKPFADQIRRALAEPDPKTRQTNLEAVVDALLSRAKKGDVNAIRELLDRVDGRVEAKVSAKLETTAAKLEQLSDEELEKVIETRTLPEWLEAEEPHP